MKRFFIISIIALFATTFIACNKNIEVTTESTFGLVGNTEKTYEYTTTKPTTSSLTELIAHNQDVQTQARIFANFVYEELENNKISENPTILVPISCDYEISETGFAPEAFCADTFFLDTNFDGVPELFVGGYGTMGTGRYSIYDAANGSKYGNAFFTHRLDGFCIANGSMYVSSGNNWYHGWTKLCVGLPSVHIKLSSSETELYDVDISINGEKQTLEMLTFNEFKALYPKYLGVEYDDLQLIGKDEDIPFVYVRDYLRVPNPENYTEEDIYNCLVELLAEYEELATEQ